MTTFYILPLMKKRPLPQKIILLGSFFFLLMEPDLFAQEKVTSALIKPDTTASQNLAQDSLQFHLSAMRISDERQSKSGNLAMLLSAVLPGSGQIYAHRYYTIPLIWGFGYYFVSSAIKSNNRYEEYRGKYAETVRLDTISHVGDSYILSVREFYHNQRDEFIFYFALTYLLNIVDAYVGATLYNFDISDNLGSGAAVQFRIPFH